ncbi:MAG: hypothetical protein ABIH23_19605, partial [bacterium]
MKRIQAFIVVVMGIVLGFASSAWSQPTAERTLAYPEYWPGMPVRVTITLSAGTGTVSVVETPPAGWTISHLNPITGTVGEGSITWDARLSAA